MVTIMWGGSPDPRPDPRATPQLLYESRCTCRADPSAPGQKGHGCRRGGPVLEFPAEPENLKNMPSIRISYAPNQLPPIPRGRGELLQMSVYAGELLAATYIAQPQCVRVRQHCLELCLLLRVWRIARQGAVRRLEMEPSHVGQLEG